MDRNEEIKDTYTFKIAIIWAALSINWLNVINNLEGTWSSLLSPIISLLVLACIGLGALQFFAKKYDELYLHCYYDIRKKSVRTGIGTAVIVYLIGILMYYLNVGLPVFYSTIALIIGAYRAYKIVKNNNPNGVS